MAPIIEHHRGVLPHHQEEAQIISLNWRIAFTLPQHLLDILQDLHELSTTYQDERNLDGAKETFQRNYAIKMQLFDDFLGKYNLPDINLCDPHLAQIVTTSMRFYDGKLYDLHAYCLMPNHLHLMIQPLANSSGIYNKVSDIVKRIKSYSAKEINQILGRTGAFWQHEYYDRFIRDDADYNRSVEYYLYNPVKAKLVAEPQDWLYSYCKMEE
ncbi:transposase [Candidatus Cloacimonadota bacterium]